MAKKVITRKIVKLGKSGSVPLGRIRKAIRSLDRQTSRAVRFALLRRMGSAPRAASKKSAVKWSLAQPSGRSSGRLAGRSSRGPGRLGGRSRPGSSFG